MIGGMLLVMLVGCGREVEEAMSPVETAPVVPPEARTDTDTDPSDLLGQPETPFPPGAIGMRGEGPQNGGPTYGPALGDIPPGGLGKGTYGAPAPSTPARPTPSK